MGGHEHGHHAPYSVPDYKIYKIEGVKEVESVNKALSRVGLKDPWARNEVWRYNVKHFGTHRSRLTTLLFRGFPLGLAAFGLTIAAEYAFGIDFHGSHHAQYTIGGQVFGSHDHGHGEGEGHH